MNRKINNINLTTVRTKSDKNKTNSVSSSRTLRESSVVFNNIFEMGTGDFKT